MGNGLDKQINENLGKYHIDDSQDKQNKNGGKYFKDYASNDPTYLASKKNLIKIKVSATYNNLDDYQDKFYMAIKYEKSTKIEQVLLKAIEMINYLKIPARFKLNKFEWSPINSNDGNSIFKSITDYKKTKLTKNILKLECKIIPLQPSIDLGDNKGTGVPLCPNMLKYNKCQIYSQLKDNYQFSESNLTHIESFTHEDNTECKYGIECRAFKRLENNTQYRIDDRCHMKLYRHPPRSGQRIKLNANINQFILGQELKEDEYYFNNQALSFAQLETGCQQLIKEVIKNEYEKDLCIDKDKDLKNKTYSILEIVNKKLNHPRHKLMGSPLNSQEMLALVLYTGCKCNLDLCKSQRDGNFKKWKYFDKCLYSAIRKLNECETGKCALYSGLGNVKLHKNKVENGYFATYTSSSWDETVAIDFIKGNNGMLLKFDENARSSMICCDVSWISLFDEKEILVARSLSSYGWNSHLFDLTVINQNNGKGIQSVAVTSHPKPKMKEPEMQFNSTCNDPFCHHIACNGIHQTNYNDPFGNDPFGNNPFSNDPFAKDPFGNDPYGMGIDPLAHHNMDMIDPVGHNDFGNPVGNDAFGGDPFGY